MNKTFLIVIALPVFAFAESLSFAAQPAAGDRTIAIPFYDQHTAGASEGAVTPVQLVYNRFAEYYERGLPEKLYLHTDKPYYAAGESIWFKGYLVDAVTYARSTGSNFMYVELIDSSKEIVCKAKVRADSLGRFYNKLDLPAKLEPGTYNLRAYTRWMTNDSTDMLFNRELEIVNPVDERVELSVQYVKNDDGTVTMKTDLSDATREPLKDTKIGYVVDFPGTGSTKGTAKTDAGGRMEITFNPTSQDQGAAVATLSIPLRANTIERRVVMPAFTDDYDVQFLPEGGVLVPGYLQKVAFKAVGSNGLSVEVTGRIYYGEEPLTEFSSSHKGMGVIELMPSDTRGYRAEVVSQDGIVKNINIDVAASGCPLKVLQRSNGLFCQINPTPDIDRGRLLLVVHSRGGIVAVESFEKGPAYIVIPIEVLAEGIAQISVVDNISGTVVSQRLMYVRNDDPLTATVTTNKKNYGRRQKVDVEMMVTDSDGYPAEGDFSVSVTDASAVRLDPMAVDINTYMHLTSELTGYIEDPGFYFAYNDYDTNFKLDLLMLTHGWRRFDLTELLQGRLSPYNVPKESELTISGLVKGALGGRPRDAKLIYFDKDRNYYDLFELQDSSRFTISGIEVADTSVIVLQALTSRGRRGGGLTLEVFKEELPAADYRVISPRLEYAVKPIPQEFMMQSKTQYYMEGGMRVIDIDEIVVTEKKKHPRETVNMIPYSPSYSMEGERLEAYSMSTLSSVLQMMPSVTIKHAENSDISDSSDLLPGEKTIYIRREPAKIFLDGMPVKFEDVEHMGVEQIQTVDVLSTSVSYILFGGLSVHIYTKLGNGTFSRGPSLAMAHIKDLGYKAAAEFYQPAYDMPENLRNTKQDARTTIAWEPALMTDEDGKVRFSFYTADKATDYDVVVEGMSPDGRTCVYRSTILRME